MRTLILMRHGKSSYPDGVDDHDRPLDERGRRQAAAAGDWIRAHVGDVEAVICSTATRTRETLERTGIEADARFESAIYGGSPEEILAEIAQVDPEVRVLLVVGHAPGVPFTALELADDASDPAAVAWLRSGFPTSALAVLEVPGDWSDVSVTRATLRDALRVD
ncbi:SixA phosphatase family protein [Rhodococcoides corynebacterioides]|uniref:Histidine phosphatase family protein n=1 Tax=Rhodococcoides corynebacterioides TaxID=53972 RepID=A0ABS7P601_9NOCA|nr:histidine phosphatase family protein [Rhodococcus corynebacterioides]MBY6367846.1 histidine phosphatase family protein [Rhodococcus corynebacterioides]MBY6408327.1 histidine phosphatase family protein [Rhodococcus corynebacterioides]